MGCPGRKAGAEMILKEPDPGNAGVGSAKGKFPASLVSSNQ